MNLFQFYNRSSDEADIRDKVIEVLAFNSIIDLHTQPRNICGRYGNFQFYNRSSLERVSGGLTEYIDSSTTFNSIIDLQIRGDVVELIKYALLSIL